MFSWRRDRVAVDAFDQHEAGWCAACYLVVVAQIVEDRWRLATKRKTGRLPDRAVDMQALLNEYDAYARAAEGPSWTACHSGYADDVVQCLVDGACRLTLLPAPAPWFGFVTASTRRGDDAIPNSYEFYVVQPADVQREIRRRGTVGLYVDGNLIARTDDDGVVEDHPSLIDDNHCVSVVGWNRQGWILRNSWGTQLPPPRQGRCLRYAGCAAHAERAAWKSLPEDPGFCVLPFSHPPLHLTGAISPWFAIG